MELFKKLLKTKEKEQEERMKKIISSLVQIFNDNQVSIAEMKTILNVLKIGYEQKLSALVKENKENEKVNNDEIIINKKKKDESVI